MPPSPQTGAASSEYRIEDLAHRSGATVRTIRAYQDRGLLPKPERRGRANVYDDSHLARLRQIADLLERGYTLASIKDLLQAWDEGRGLGGVLGLVAEVDGPWTDEESGRVSRGELDELFGGQHDDTAVNEAVALGVLVRLPDRDDEFLVPSPQELAVAAELHKAGVPLLAITDHLRELRGQVEHIAARFLDFTNEHVFIRYLGARPSELDATEAADLVRRLRPLAQQTVEAELARAMQKLAARNLRDHLRSAAAAPPPQVTAPPAEQVRLPMGTVDAVRTLVGEGAAPGFIAAAAEREVRARVMDRMAAGEFPGDGSLDTAGPPDTPNTPGTPSSPNTPGTPSSPDSPSSPTHADYPGHAGHPGHAGYPGNAGHPGHAGYLGHSRPASPHSQARSADRAGPIDQTGPIDPTGPASPAGIGPSADSGDR